jgi:hypothetical protein
MRNTEELELLDRIMLLFVNILLLKLCYCH